MKPAALLVLLVIAGLALLLLGLMVGSTGWSVPWDGVADLRIVWDIRAPRCAGAWLAGALLGLGGAIAQGLFRNPLADPYLLGSSSGAGLGVAVLLGWLGSSAVASTWSLRLGLTGAAFVGATLAVWLTLVLARGVQHTLRLLLAGVVVGVVLGALSSLTMLLSPEIMRTLQSFMLGSTGFLGWNSVVILAVALVISVLLALACSRALDALTLGDAAALSLGVHLTRMRLMLVATMALATGAAVAQVGMISFVGLAAPHMVRSRVRAIHGPLMMLSALSGGALLLAADILARWARAPQELPVGVLTAVLGGGYLLWRMNHA